MYLRLFFKFVHICVLCVEECHLCVGSCRGQESVSESLERFTCVFVSLSGDGCGNRFSGRAGKTLNY